jgi:hypothetical protein
MAILTSGRFGSNTVQKLLDDIEQYEKAFHQLTQEEQDVVEKLQTTENTKPLLSRLSPEVYDRVMAFMSTHQPVRFEKMCSERTVPKSTLPNYNALTDSFGQFISLNHQGIPDNKFIESLDKFLDSIPNGPVSTVTKFAQPVMYDENAFKNLIKK